MATIVEQPPVGVHARAGNPPMVYERQVGSGLLGLTAALVGAWGLICGYIGPYFGFRPLSYNAWTGSLQEGLLHAAPGAAAILAGLMLMAMGPARRSVSRFGLVLPAVALVATGAWFVVGPAAWPAIEPGTAFMAASPLRSLLDMAGANLAPGLVLVTLGGMALKASIVPPVPVEDPMTPASADARPAIAPDAAPASTGSALADPTFADEEPGAARTGV